MNKQSDDSKHLIDFAGKIGRVEKGLEDLTTHFTNHLSQHSIAAIMRWAIMGLQVIVIIVLGIVFFK